MRPRALLAAILLAALIAAAVQQMFLVIPLISVPVAAAVGGSFVGYAGPVRHWPAGILPAAVLGFTTVGGCIVAMLATGATPLEARYLSGWLIAAAVGGAVSFGFAWLGGVLRADDEG